ncbi:diguanylate cyclase domain-containing protein [Candidatus Caldatribacterium sp. SIUC1]|uniref:GGDEF domain-containing protein n=1 Tax=Candidatus Caldatribacterium sp. SIUC1 TaxID=3418365 RepID=UPI003F68ECBE
MGGKKSQSGILRELTRLFPLPEGEEGLFRIFDFALKVLGASGLLYVRGERRFVRGAGFPQGVENLVGSCTLRRGTVNSLRFRRFVIAREAELFVFWEENGRRTFPLPVLSLVVRLLELFERLDHARKRWLWLFDGNPDLLFFLDEQGRILEVNARGERILGRRKEDLVGRAIAEYIGEETWWLLKEEAQGGRGPARIELTLSRPGTHLAHFEALLFAFEGGRVFWLVLRDIGERKRYESVLLRFALYDQLTEVYNRRFLEEYLRKELERARREGYPLALVMLDIDAFKAINDRYGHVFGDEVLRMVARLLQESLRSSDVVARYGGDEFVLVLPKVKEVDVHKIMERVSRNLRGAQVMGEPFPVRISYGVCLWDGQKNVSELFQEIDRKMYEMKKQRSGVS